MKIKIVCVGKIKEKYFVEAISEYLKRLSSYTNVEIIEVSEYKINDNPSNKDIEKVLEEESKDLLKKIKNDDYVIALDLQGKDIDNYKYNKIIDTAKNNGKSSFVFIIGGSYGLSNKIREKADFLWKFSNLVFTHQMIRVILLEQIYRGFKIGNNEPYHK